MIDVPYEEEATTLLQQTTMAGYSVSQTRLTKWHRADLLPRPQQRGLGQGRGSASYYPRGTGDQLIALCQLRKHERRIDPLRWKLWWFGYPIPDARIREQLFDAITREEQAIRDFQQRMQESQHAVDMGEEDAVPDFLAQYERERLYTPELRRQRKRVGRRNFSTFMRLQLAFSSGDMLQWKALADQDIFFKGLGWELRHQGHVNSVPDGLRKHLNGELPAWSVAKSPGKKRAILETMSAADLCVVREEVRIMLQYMHDAYGMCNVFDLAHTASQPTNDQEAKLQKYCVRENKRTRRLLAEFVKDRDATMVQRDLLIEWVSLRQIDSCRAWFANLAAFFPIMTILGAMIEHEFGSTGEGN